MTSPAAVVPSISGISALDCFAVMEQLVGSAAFARGRQRLSTEVQRELDSISAVSWVSNSAVNQLMDEVARAAERDPEELIDQTVRISAERMFKTVWRVLLRMTSDEALIKRTPMFYARSRNTGQVASRIIAPGRAELLLTAWPDVSDRTLRTIGVGIQCVVELAGRQQVRMTYTRTAEGGRYEIRWKD
jgi:hypothetical protein